MKKGRKTSSSVDWGLVCYQVKKFFLSRKNVQKGFDTSPIFVYTDNRQFSGD